MPRKIITGKYSSATAMKYGLTLWAGTGSGRIVKITRTTSINANRAVTLRRLMSLLADCCWRRTFR